VLLEGLFRRSRAVLGALAIVVVAGIVALEEIPKEAEPDVDLPVFHISTRLSGLSPTDADRLLVRPLERELRDLEGLKELRSSASPGHARLRLEFDVDYDRGRAFDLLREKINAAKVGLPDGASEPRIEEVNLSRFPLMVVTLSAPMPDSELLRYAKQLEHAIERLDEILDVTIIGERDEVIEIVIDPLLLESYGLDVPALLRTVAGANQAVRAGTVDTSGGRLALTVPGLFTRPADIRQLPVRASQNSVLTVGDVATVRRTLEDPRSLARVDGQPAIALSVTKRVGENVIDTLETMRELIAETTARWPQSITIGYTQDGSWRIRTRIAELRNSLISAVALVMIIVIATLGVRSGLLVGVAIPGAFLLAILALLGLGISINTAVLYSFVMSVGLLVDGAIVMVENAERLIREGTARFQAYVRSVRSLWLPIVTSTATTLAAFLPLLTWPGVIGGYLKFLPLTVLLTLTASLVMALLFVPVLGTVLGTRGTPVARTSARPDALTRTYLAVLEHALRRPAWVVISAGALLVWSMWIYERQGQGVEFLPEIEPSRAVLQVRARGGLSFAEKRDLALEVERIALQFDAFRSVFLIVGDAGTGGRVSTDIIAELRLEFRDWHAHAPADDVLAELKRRTQRIAGINVEIQASRGGPRSGKPIQLDVTGEDPAELDAAVGQALRELRRLKGVKGIEDSRPSPGIEWQLDINRAQAARFGVDLIRAGQYAQLVTTGLKLGRVRPATQERTHADDIGIVARFPARYRNLEGLAAIRVPARGGTVPLDQFTTLSPVPRGGDVERVDGVRARRVVADVEPNLPKEERLGDLMQGVRGWTVGSALPGETQVAIRGEEEDRDEAREFLLRAFMLALALIALILVLQFNSFYQAGLILFAIVLSTVGVRVGLLIIDQPFGMVMSGIGVIALAGIVVNNNIILVSTYTAHVAGGKSAYDALRETGRTRLRPVLLTTVTTVAGLMPLVLRLDIDYVERTVAFGAPTTQYWVQMSSAVVFGLVFASLLTLFITPAALMLWANLTAAREQARRREHETGRAESIARVFEVHGLPVGVAALTAIVAAWAFIPELVFVRATDILSRQLFRQPPSGWFQALEWASFWSLIALGAGYAYWKNAHVRVDIIRERLSDRGKAWVEIFGFVVLLLPVCAVVLIVGWEFVVRSFLDGELSGALMGSETRWIFKAMMLLCFAQLLWLGGYVTWRNLRFLRGRERTIFPPEPTGASRDGPAS